MIENDILLERFLIPDPDAERELGGSSQAVITDAEIKNCRILVTRKEITLADFTGIPGGMVQLSCSFQPAVGTRFSYGQFWLQLLQPNDIRFFDISPRIVNDPNPVEFTLDHKGTITLKHPTFPLEPSLERGTSKKYTRYHCSVQGTGIGTNIARWDFRENPDRKDGIGLEQIVSFTVPTQSIIEASVMVSARIVRSGMPGMIDAVRDLILGSQLNDHAVPIQIDFST